MRVWYFPSWNGDFRLVAHPQNDKRSVLEIVDPTPSEEEILLSFIEEANKLKWTTWPRSKGLKLRAGKRNIKLSVSVNRAGSVLLPLLRPKEQTLTAIQLEDGQLKIVEGADSAALTVPDSGPETPYRKPDETPEPDPPKPKEKAAASVSRPTPCCPTCVPGAVERASEVLLTFLTPEQHQQWAQTRTIDVVGHLSGHQYRLAHRKSPLAALWGRMCADLTDGGVLHFHDWSVPPEEEVLAAKLVLEHREPWLRNEATCLGMPFRNGDYAVGGMGQFTDVFKNPFGDGGDGTESAGMMSQVGSFLLGMIGRRTP